LPGPATLHRLELLAVGLLQEVRGHAVEELKKVGWRFEVPVRKDLAEEHRPNLLGEVGRVKQGAQLLAEVAANDSQHVRGVVAVEAFAGRSITGARFLKRRLEVILASGGPSGRSVLRRNGTVSNWLRAAGAGRMVIYRSQGRHGLSCR
jgi:hypothetical protein